MSKRFIDVHLIHLFAASNYELWLKLFDRDTEGFHYHEQPAVELACRNLLPVVTERKDIFYCSASCYIY